MVEFFGGGRLSWDLTSLNRPHCGGGQLVWERFPCSQQPHYHKPKGGKGQWQKDREGAPRGDDRDEKTPHTTGGESGGPCASKVATGEK